MPRNNIQGHLSIFPCESKRLPDHQSIRSNNKAEEEGGHDIWPQYLPHKGRTTSLPNPLIRDTNIGPVATPE
jgi:hypothetical protein